MQTVACRTCGHTYRLDATNDHHCPERPDRLERAASAFYDPLQYTLYSEDLWSEPPA